jgi:3-hydroxyisobutyrate dehydrogenase
MTGENDVTVGFVGLGDMGSRMVKRLMDAGRPVIGYNRTGEKAEPLLAAGMAWADSPAAVAAAADITISMVTDSVALEAVCRGLDGVLDGLGPGKIYVDMSTVDPIHSREVAADVAKTGARMLDAPVSGSTLTLEQGKLSIMVGGPPEAFEQAKPVLLDIGPTITYLGPNGAGASMKLAVNIGICVQTMVFCEGIVMAEKAGVSREVAVETYLKTVVASPALKYRGPLVLDMPEMAMFNVEMMQKDLILALQAGRELEVPLPTTAATNEILTAARGLGWGEKDFAVMFDVIARMAGLAQ